MIDLDDREALIERRPTIGPPGASSGSDAALARIAEAAPDGQVIIPIARIHELRAAKDAALAAIERVRALHKAESNERYTWCVGCSTDEYPEDWPCPSIQALDGAPEPERLPVEGEKP